LPSKAALLPCYFSLCPVCQRGTSSMIRAFWRCHKQSQERPASSVYSRWRGAPASRACLTSDRLIICRIVSVAFVSSCCHCT
jgi:hypothetical protein